MPTINLGKVRPNYRGAYNNTTTYNQNDSVYEGNAAYVCTADGIVGESPSGEVNWTKILDISTSTFSSLTLTGAYSQSSGNFTYTGSAQVNFTADQFNVINSFDGTKFIRNFDAGSGGAASHYLQIGALNGTTPTASARLTTVADFSGAGTGTLTLDVLNAGVMETALSFSSTKNATFNGATLTAGNTGADSRVVSKSNANYNFRAENAAGNGVHFGATSGATPSGVISNNAGTAIATFGNGLSVSHAGEIQQVRTTGNDAVRRYTLGDGSSAASDDLSIDFNFLTGVAATYTWSNVNYQFASARGAGSLPTTEAAALTDTDFYIDSSGNGNISGQFDIGTYLNFPNSTGTGAAGERYIGTDGANRMYYNVPTGLAHKFGVNNTDIMDVLSTGIDALVPLTVTGTVTIAGGNRLAINSGGTASGTSIYSPSANEMGFSTNGVEFLRADSSQNVTLAADLIVGATGGSTTGKITESFDGNLENALYIRNTDTGTASQFLQAFDRNGTLTGSIQHTNTATTFNTSSDPDLKYFVSDDDVDAEFEAICNAKYWFFWRSEVDELAKTVPEVFNDDGSVNEKVALANGLKKVHGFNAHEVVDAGLDMGTEGKGPRNVAIGEVYEVEEIPEITEEVTEEVQATVTKTREVQRIELIDGVPTQITEIEEYEEPIFDEIEVVDTDGNPVMEWVDSGETETVIIGQDEEGNDITEEQPILVERQLTHAVPVMETVTKTIVVQEAKTIEHRRTPAGVDQSKAIPATVGKVKKHDDLINDLLSRVASLESAAN